MNTRFGIGYDVHPIVAGSKGLFLGGLKVSNSLYLSGHSDGDVLSHAIVDAILGACSLGNIGLRYPENSSNKDRRSIEFLKETADLIKGNWEVNNVDSVVVIEEIRLAGFVQSMIDNVASALGIESELVNIKPKSGNGSSPGFAKAYAVCLLRRVE